MVIETILEPSEMLVKALNEKTAPQLLRLYYTSLHQGTPQAMCIHFAVIDVLLAKFPDEYEMIDFPVVEIVIEF